MPSRNINVEISVYDRLRKLKKEDESFSEAVNRLLEVSGRNINASFGALKDISYSEIKKSRGDRDVVL